MARLVKVVVSLPVREANLLQRAARESRMDCAQFCARCLQNKAKVLAERWVWTQGRE